MRNRSLYFNGEYLNCSYLCNILIIKAIIKSLEIVILLLLIFDINLLHNQDSFFKKQ